MARGPRDDDSRCPNYRSGLAGVWRCRTIKGRGVTFVRVGGQDYCPECANELRVFLAQREIRGGATVH